MAVPVLWVSLRTGEDACPSFCTGRGVAFPILFCLWESGEGSELARRVEPPSLQ